IPAGASNRPTFLAADSFNGFCAARFTKSSSQRVTIPQVAFATLQIVYNIRTADVEQALCGIDSGTGTSGAFYMTANDGVTLHSGARHNNGVNLQQVTSSGSTDGFLSYTDGEGNTTSLDGTFGTAWVGVPTALTFVRRGSYVEIYRADILIDRV